MQAIDQPLLNLSAIPGITTPQINYGVSIGGKDRPENGATAGADWLSNLTGIPADLFYKLTDTLDSVQDGALYGKILATDISEGHILLSSAEGSLDNIADGATYGRILLTGISAGKIVLAQVDGDLDDIADGSNFGKVSSTNISAGNIVLQVDQNLSQQGIKIITASTGARVELLPDANTGISILDDEGNPVFQALVGGTNIGDVIIGDYVGGQGLLYDKSAGTIKYKNLEWSEVTDNDGNKPANNATVGATIGTDLSDSEAEIPAENLVLNYRKYTYGENITQGNIVCVKPGITDIICSDDAWVWGEPGHQDSNFGSDSKLICNPTNVTTSYINFDLSGLQLPQYIIKAELVLTSQTVPASEATISIQKLNASWSEDTITYNNAPAYENSYINQKFGAQYQQTVDSAHQSVIFDITQWIRQIASGDEDNFGFFVNSDIGLYFDSKDTVGGTPAYIRIYTRSDSDGKVYKSNRTDYMKCRAIVGVAQATANAETENNIQIIGVSNDFSGLYPGSNVYLDSSDGGVAQTITNPTRQILIGKALSANDLLLDIQHNDIVIENAIGNNYLRFDAEYGHTRRIYAPVDARYIVVSSYDDNNVKFVATIYRDISGISNQTVGDTDNSYLTAWFNNDYVDLTLYGYSTYGSIQYAFYN